MVVLVDGAEEASLCLEGSSGRRYNVQLSPAESATVRATVQPIVAAAAARLGLAFAATSLEPARAQAVREWARANGRKVARTGRLSRAVIAEYENAVGPKQTAAPAPSVAQAVPEPEEWIGGVERHVRPAGLDGGHAGGQVHRQPTERLGDPEQDVEQCFR